MLKKELGLFLLICRDRRDHGCDQPAIPVASELDKFGQSDRAVRPVCHWRRACHHHGRIELSVGSVFALLGIIFLDLLINYEVTWPVALVITLLGGLSIRAAPAF
jgi:ribose transport system permease protein